MCPLAPLRLVRHGLRRALPFLDTGHTADLKPVPGYRIKSRLPVLDHLRSTSFYYTLIGNVACAYCYYAYVV